MSMFAKFSLIEYIKTLCATSITEVKNIVLSNGEDLFPDTMTPLIVVEQMPDISSISKGSGFDLFIIRMMHPQTTNDIIYEIMFNKLTDPFKKGVKSSYSSSGISTNDFFTYQDGSENKSGRQNAGSRLFYKQFLVYAPKTN